MANDNSAIGFEELGIGDVLKRYHLLVPLNQRDYAWGQPQVENLLEDVADAISSDEPQHFLGLLVTIRGKNNVLEVADGQQRLATTTLIFAAMRSIVGNMGSTVDDQHKIVTRAIDSFLSSVETTAMVERPKLTLNTADSSVFHSLIVTGKAGDAFVKNRDSHELLEKAYNLAKSYLSKKIEGLSSQEKLSIFKAWINYFQDNTRVILLTVSSTANSFRMFETLNDRGLKVSQSDLIKSYIFKESEDRISDSQQSWSSIKGVLETLDNEDIMMNFIRHSLIVTNGFVKQRDIYDKVKSTTKGEQSSVDLLSTWESLAGYYAALSNPASLVWNEFPNKIQENIKVLNLFNIAPLKPLLLAAAKMMSPEEAALTFERVVAIGVRLIIASKTTTQSVEEPLGDVARKVWTKEIKDSKEVVNALSSSIPNDQQFKDAFAQATVWKAGLARYYLRSLERVASKEPDPWLIPNDDPNTITLEHILPQKPGNNWPKWSEDEVKAYVKRIGNMVLLTKDLNSTLKNKSFADKRSRLKESPYKTTSMVCEQDEWLPDQVLERQKTLAESALKAWPLR